MKSFIIFVHSELAPPSVPKLPFCFSSSASSQPPYHPLSFGSFLSSFFTTENPKSLISIQKPKSKTPRRCQNASFGLSRSHESPRESGKNEMELGWREWVPKNRNPNLQMCPRLTNSCPWYLYQQEITPNISPGPLNRRSPWRTKGNGAENEARETLKVLGPDEPVDRWLYLRYYLNWP